MFLNKNQLKQIAIDQNADSMKTFSSVIEKTIAQSTPAVIPNEVEESLLDTIVKNLAAENINFRISIIDFGGTTNSKRQSQA